MINKLKLINFQSHKNTELNFHPGINVIIGTSDGGKSAILRGLFWANDNRPPKGIYISHWAYDKETKKQIDPCCIVVEKDTYKLKRKRTADFNGYMLTGVDGEKQTFKNIKTDVPDEVNSFFNLSPVNLKKQHDSHFLLSNTPGEVARFLNQIIKLDSIDKTLSLTESKKRGEKNLLGISNTRYAEINTNIEKLAWVSEARVMVDKGISMQQRIDTFTDKKNNIESLIKQIEYCSETIETENKLIELSPVITDYEKYIEEINIYEDDIKNITDLVDDYDDYKKKSEIKLGTLQKDVEQLEEFTEQSTQIEIMKTEIQDLCKQQKSLNEDITLYKNNIKKYTKQLPEACEACGRPF